MHIPVLLKELVDQLNINPDGIYVDLTLGRGGHSIAILKKLTTGKLIVFDKDKQAIEASKNKLLAISKNVIFVWSDFANFENHMNELGISKVDGIVADLGVSSPQIDDPERGFSYRFDARVDMRMNQSQTLDAHQILNSYSEQQLVEILANYGEIKPARQIAKAIISNRPVNTTFELVNIVRNCLSPALLAKKNLVKNVFQALRIAVNGELDALQSLLFCFLSFLKQGGKFAVITFHSLEDKLVKFSFKKLLDKNKTPFFVKDEPSCFVKTIWPTLQEIESNPRSKSAKLRILTKLKDENERKI